MTSIIIADPAYIRLLYIVHSTLADSNKVIISIDTARLTRHHSKCFLKSDMRLLERTISRIWRIDMKAIDAEVLGFSYVGTQLTFPSCTNEQ